MTHSRAEQSYQKRVARVVAFIVANPMVEHRLETLAAIAHFSPFHFHRVYRGVVGETVNATVRRIRLTHAGRLLQDGAHSVAQIAAEAGYESPQAFTRAFGHFVGQSPRGFQRHLRMDDLDANTGTGCTLARGTASPAVRVVERPAQRIHTLRHHGPPATIAHTQRRLQMHPAIAAAAQWLGVAYGDPDDASEFTYYAAAALADTPKIVDTEMEVHELAAGAYAVHRLVGPYTRINATFAALYARWLPASGYEPDDRPVLEHYLNSPSSTAAADLVTDLLIPIRLHGAP